ncbi:Flp pilus assembly protein TadB [Actinoplanes regularis]|uniref:Flp pilus assembly protein TadB n=1 Tax=Actinoplanes regularis TaxID=52697 RepID=A0A239EXH7_9ACTN|nr:Flp pilus assembly protein TadB [Actinoplanes regularis]
MTALSALLGAGVGLGFLAMFAGLRRPAASDRRRTSGIRFTREHLVRLAVALAVAALAGLLTRWPVGAILAGVGAYALPIALGTNKKAARDLARTEAVAVWTEMLRDNLSGASGLEQSILVTAPHAPAAIKTEIDDLAAAVRLGHRLPIALAELRARLHDRTGRLVVRALIQASTRQSRQLAELLSELASRARARATLRLKIEPGHAKIRTNARVITAFTVVMAVGLIVFNPTFLVPYRSLAGQLTLVVVGAMFAIGFLGIARLARIGVTEGARS